MVFGGMFPEVMIFHRIPWACVPAGVSVESSYYAAYLAFGSWLFFVNDNFLPRLNRYRIAV